MQRSWCLSARRSYTEHGEWGECWRGDISKTQFIEGMVILTKDVGF